VTGEADRREKPVGPMVRISAGQVGRPSPARATTSDRVLPRALVTRAGRGLAARVATSAFMARGLRGHLTTHTTSPGSAWSRSLASSTRSTYVPNVVFDEDSSTAGSVQRSDLTGRILPGRRHQRVPQKMTGAHRATVSITSLVGEKGDVDSAHEL
jgi:hypothetical protein